MILRMTSVLLLAAAPILAGAVEPKLGLWKNTVTTTFAEPPIEIPAAQLDRLRSMGIEPPGYSPQTHTQEHCLTQAELDRFMAGGMGDSNCSLINPKKTARGISGDLSCVTQGQSAQGHVDIIYDDERHYHGSSQLNGTFTIGGKSKSVDMNVQLSGQYEASDCPSAVK